MGAKIRTWVPQEEQQVLLIIEPSLQTKILILRSALATQPVWGQNGPYEILSQINNLGVQFSVGESVVGSIFSDEKTTTTTKKTGVQQDGSANKGIKALTYHHACPRKFDP